VTADKTKQTDIPAMSPSPSRTPIDPRSARLDLFGEHHDDVTGAADIPRALGKGSASLGDSDWLAFIVASYDSSPPRSYGLVGELM
jgi:hypothetical protein